MPRLVLVRHGEAAAGWGDDPDPGLSERGFAQAEAMADVLASAGPLPVVASPLRRTRETAAALERRWGVTATVEPGVGEVPSPTDAPEGRLAWLRRLLPLPRDEWPAELQEWQRSVVATLLALPTDTVVVTHFVLITVAAATPGYQPDHCSRTVVDATPDGLRVVSLGEQRATVVR
jgi:broad specificity phosphatase PhoE